MQTISGVLRDKRVVFATVAVVAVMTLIFSFLASVMVSPSRVLAGHSCSFVPTDQTVKQGETAIYDFTLNPSAPGNAFELTFGGLPFGVTAMLSSMQGTAPATVKLSLSVSRDARIGEVNLSTKYTDIDASGTRTEIWCQLGLTIMQNTAPIQIVKGVSIDIKPGTTPNAINLGSNGVVQTAILSSADFNALRVDPLSVTLASAQVALKGKGTSQTSSADVNGDGITDLVVAISTEALQLAVTDTEASLAGKTYENIEIRGKDTVQIVP